MTLAKEKCTACTSDSPIVSADEAAELLKELPDWTILPFDNIDHLVKAYNFGNFINAMNFTVGVGELAEEVDHHPTLITTWGKVTIHWWTHTTDGLHRNDFIMAAKTDELFIRLTQGIE